MRIFIEAIEHSQVFFESRVVDIFHYFTLTNDFHFGRIFSFNFSDFGMASIWTGIFSFDFYVSGI